MTDASVKPPKTIGVPNDVWRELKILSMERDETLGETIRFLLQQAEAENGRDPEPAEPAKKTRRK